MKIILFLLSLFVFISVILASLTAFATDLNNNSNVIIVQPANEETIQYDEGKVCIKIAINPELKPGYKVVLFLDGKKNHEQQQNEPFCIYHIERGEHQLIASIMLQNSDTQIFTSQPIKFFMHQTSTANH